MTFAPATIREVRALLKGEDADLDDAELGIVGGPSHVRTGTSYHLGADQLIMSKNPYSARTVRDKAGLSNAASALDIDDDLDELRELSVWLVAQCRAGVPDTLDIREIIYSPDGVAVFRWDRERGVSSQPQPDSDLSHLTHTHISWYRDGEFRDKTAVFKRFFEGDDMAINEAMFEGLAWRMDALIFDLPTVRGGPTAGERNGNHHALKALEAKVDRLSGPAPVDPEALKRALLDPQVLAGIAKAVNDDAHLRLES